MRSRPAPSTAPPCVVVGLDQNGLGVVRALGRERVPVIAVTDANPRAQAATRFATVVTCADLRHEPLIETLTRIAVEAAAPPVLIATMDRTVNLLSEHRAALDRHYQHSLPPVPVVQQLMSKALTDSFARAHGFQVPQTFVVRDEEGLGRCASQIQFPCILKPQIKTVDFVEHTPRKAFRVTDEEELFRTYCLVSQWEPDVVIQEWVPGSDNRLVFCLYYFDRHGQPLGWFGGRKIRQYIPYCGTACSAEPWRDDATREAGLRFFQAAGYTGFGAIEFKIDPAGRYHLIEPTVGRTEHLFALAAANGVNLPYIGYRDSAGLPPLGWSLSRRPRIYLDWRRDLRAARFYVAQGELTWRAWAVTLARRQQYALFAWDDPVPFARHSVRRAIAAASGAVRKLRAVAGRGTDRLAEWWGGDHAGVPLETPRTNSEHAAAAVAWLCAAQDAAPGGGVARGYSISTRSSYPRGWQAAYPETTGYIIPTFYDCARTWNRPDLAIRADRMARWILTLQLPNGGFPGGTIDRRAPAVVFNTGMILIGLCRAYAETRCEALRASAGRAVDFLIEAQSRDGGWRRFTRATGEPVLHAYDLLVCVGLLAAAAIREDDRIVEAVRRNLEFSLSLQRPNGWLESNGNTRQHHAHPPTHTLAYAAAGFLECGLRLGDARYVEAARRIALPLARHVAADGFLAGRFDREWAPAAEWCCLTGNAQMAVVWWRLHAHAPDAGLAGAARRALRYVKCRQDLAHRNDGIRGGIAGSYPIDGRYGSFQFLNWVAKFFVDALALEDAHAE